jgi:hypothetical protein
MGMLSRVIKAIIGDKTRIGRGVEREGGCVASEGGGGGHAMTDLLSAETVESITVLHDETIMCRHTLCVLRLWLHKEVALAAMLGTELSNGVVDLGGTARLGGPELKSGKFVDEGVVDADTVVT